jgi:diguanylate cyclase (GGDEF)-like protein/PAS domain S-box-containing protein
VLALGYLLAAVVGIMLTREAGNAAALWPANALLLGVLLRSERSDWIAYVVGCGLANFAANFGFGDPAQIALGFVFCNLVEVFTAVLLLRYLYPGQWDFGSLSQMLSFAAVSGVLAPSVGASFGAGLMYWAFNAPYASVWGVWWVADAIGFLIVTPVVLIATRDRLAALIKKRGGEATALLVVLVAVTFLVFSQSRFPVLYLVAPILLWAAFRLDILGSAIMGLLVSAISVGMTIYGLGPIPEVTSGNMGDRVQFLQLFLGVAVLMPMVAAVLFSAMRSAERSLYAEKVRAEVTLHSIGDAVITTDAQGNVKFMNPVAEQLTGWPLAEARGQPVDTVFLILNEDDRTPVASPVAHCLAKEAIVGHGDDTILVGLHGNEYSIQDSAAPIWSPEHELMGVVLVFSDVTEHRRLAREASHHAAHDSLTGLVNRREFEKRLQRVLDTAHRDDRVHALVYLDLDQFKVINDTKGHSAGDELLRQLSRRLSERTRHRDTFARLGGDEFGLLMEHCSLEQAQHIAEELHASISEFRFMWEHQPFRIGASMGLVAVDATSRSITELLRRADAACYVAKEQGRNRIHIYTEDDSRLAERRGEMQWVGRIQRALEENRFRLYYQPIVALSEVNSDEVRCELLLRLEDETGDVVPPGAFLPAAERYDLAVAIDQWVVSHALDWLAAHPSFIDQVAHCAINLSGHSLADTKMAAFIESQFQTTKVPPGKICFEVTETAAIANLGAAATLFDRLKELGCKFALDDFGTGLSSFGYLKNLPVDYLKIDGIFVKDIAGDPIDFAIVKSINELGHVTGKKTIAEFAENDAIVEKLRALEVDYAQGYSIGRPKPLEAPSTDNVVTLRATS